MKFPKVRDILNEIRWTGDLSRCRLVVQDRMGVEGHKVVEGSTIMRIGKREFDTDTATIPFYKVCVIYYDGKRVWERPA